MRTTISMSFMKRRNNKRLRMMSRNDEYKDVIV